MLKKLGYGEVAILVSPEFLRSFGLLTPKQQSVLLSFLESPARSVKTALTVFELLDLFGLDSERAFRNDLKVLLLGGFIEETKIVRSGSFKKLSAYYVSEYVSRLVKHPFNTALVDKVKHEKEKAEIKEFKEKFPTWHVDKSDSFFNRG